MVALDDVDEVVEQYHLALGEFVKGDPKPLKMMYSHREDVTLALTPLALPLFPASDALATRPARPGQCP
jgi:hypothetical protein